MFTFNEERLAYLLSKLQAEINKKVDKDKYIKEASENANGAFTVVADNTNPFDESTMIKLSDIQSVIPLIAVGAKVDATLEDKKLSAEVFTPQEKAILAEILTEGSLDELINKRLDGMTLDIISSTDYADKEAAGTLEQDKLYIVSDDTIKAINLDEYAKQEDVDELEELKQDKETYIGRVEVVADGAVIDNNTQIAVSDPRINGQGYTVGQIIELEKPKVLSEMDFTEEDKAFLDSLIDKGIDDLLFKNDVVNTLESDAKDLPLSANQGKILKEDYLDSMKHVYLTEEEYAALMPVTIDAAGTLTVKETVADSSTEISIDDDIIIWNNKALLKSGSELIKVDDKIILGQDQRADDVVYHITDAEELYGLTEEQLEHLKIAYEHTFIDLDSKYANMSEIVRARADANGNSFSSLADRLLAIDSIIDTLLLSMNTVQTNLNDMQEGLEEIQDELQGLQDGLDDGETINEPEVEDDEIIDEPEIEDDMGHPDDLGN